MSALTRRRFLGNTAALAVAAMAPIPRAMALVATDGPPLRWYAVGDGEMSYAFLAESIEAARREYAWAHGATISEECPECGEYACHEHNEDLDAPLDWVEVNHTFGAEFTPDKPPKMVDWMRSGFMVPCEDCDDYEPTECREYKGRALCDQCFDTARTESLDRFLGVKTGSVGHAD